MPSACWFIDLKAGVGRHEARLDSGNVDARYFGGGVLVGGFAGVTRKIGRRGCSVDGWTYITQAPVPQPTSSTRWDGDPVVRCLQV